MWRKDGRRHDEVLEPGLLDLLMVQLPPAIVSYVNARAAASQVPVTVSSIEFPTEESLLVRCSATKFGMSVDLRATAEFGHSGEDLVLSSIRVEAVDGGVIKRKVVDWFSSAVIWHWGDALAEHGIRLRR